jgi:hypothetical protein
MPVYVSALSRNTNARSSFFLARSAARSEQRAEMINAPCTNRERIKAVQIALRVLA